MSNRQLIKKLCKRARISFSIYMAPELVFESLNHLLNYTKNENETKLLNELINKYKENPNQTLLYLIPGSLWSDGKIF